MSTSAPEDDAEAVLRVLEESGVFDTLRQQLLLQIRSNVCPNLTCMRKISCTLQQTCLKCRRKGVQAARMLLFITHGTP